MTETPLVLAADMGYGHIRAASALAGLWGTSVGLCDRPPLAGPEELSTWKRSRGAYEWCTRNATVPVLGAPLRPLVKWLTSMPKLEASRDLTGSPWMVRRLQGSIQEGLGAELVRQLRERPRPLVATYFVPALAADAAGCSNVYLVVTDSEVHRVWAPVKAEATRIQYLVPAERTRLRLLAYGVPAECIHNTGFPLPDELVGEDDAHRKAHLAARMARLDPQGTFRSGAGAQAVAELNVPPAAQDAPVQITFAIGGAGAQVALARRTLRALVPLLEEGRVRLTLVAGVRRRVYERLRHARTASKLSTAALARVEVLYCEQMSEYLAAFHALLARTDLLWTKPSELTFFAALGLPLLLAPPVGVHEGYNGRLVVEQGAAFWPPRLATVAAWLRAGLADGRFAAAAWAGYRNLPAHGAYRIRDLVNAAQPGGRSEGSL